MAAAATLEPAAAAARAASAPSSAATASSGETSTYSHGHSARGCTAHADGDAGVDDDDAVLSFVCNNSRKPHQDGSAPAEAGGAGEHWTLLSTAGFAERQFHGNRRGYREAAERQMLAALG
ncbi:MAG: hypothetical protein VX113_08795, partial [Pseudomonadota bacterium]|nr:hypothetical protein [Pseudomonadota bacterium]